MMDDAIVRQNKLADLFDANLNSAGASSSPAASNSVLSSFFLFLSHSKNRGKTTCSSFFDRFACLFPLRSLTASHLLPPASRTLAGAGKNSISMCAIKGNNSRRKSSSTKDVEESRQAKRDSVAEFEAAFPLLIAPCIDFGSCGGSGSGEEGVTFSKEKRFSFSCYSFYHILLLYSSFSFSFSFSLFSPLLLQVI